MITESLRPLGLADGFQSRVEIRELVSDEARSV
jgi:hypothetical protein